MSQFRYALGRLMGGLLAMGLFALLLNALILSQQHFSQSAQALSGPQPPRIPLGQMSPAGQGAEVHVTARIDAAIDVAVPGGTARLVLLSDPSGRAGSPARAAVFVSPADLDAFEQSVAANTLSASESGPVIALNGAVTLPYWIDRAESAAAEAKRPLASGVVFIRPFLAGRAAGLAPPLLSYVVPAALAALLVALLWSELGRMLARRRAMQAYAQLQHLDHETGAAAALSTSLAPGDAQWAALAVRRDALRRKRAQLDRLFERGLAAQGGRWVWLAAAAAGGLAGIVPRRPLAQAVGSHLLGADPAQAFALSLPAGWAVSMDHLLDYPGDILARSVIALFGPQSIGIASGIRNLPVTVWVALAVVALLVTLRRAETRRSLRGTLR